MAEENDPIPAVICKSCNKEYDSAVTGEYTHLFQGHDCASTVYEADGKWYLRGDYGSTNFDLDVYVFKKEPEEKYKTGPICDHCIQALILAREIEFALELA